MVENPAAETFPCLQRKLNARKGIRKKKLRLITSIVIIKIYEQIKAQSIQLRGLASGLLRIARIYT
ncbi:MAG: hypothetical protein WAK17_17950 [Candidatus Nitrosopolaris sp.]